MSISSLPTLSPAQHRLLNAATAAFAELGFGGTSTRDIAARAERSPSAVYIHYPTKEDLLFAISVRGHQRSLACLRAAAGALDPVVRLRDMVFAFSMWHMNNAKLGRVVQYEFFALTQEHQAEVTALRRKIKKLMVQVIKDGVSAGVFDVADPRGAAEALLSLSIDLVRWFDSDRKRSQAAIADQHADLAIRMVRAR